MKNAVLCCFFLVIFSSFSAFAYGQRPGGKVTFRLEEAVAGAGSTKEVTFVLYRVKKSCCDDCQRACRWCCVNGAQLVDKVTMERGEGEFKNLPPGEYFLINKTNGTFAGYERKIEIKEKGTTRLGTFSVDSGTYTGNMTDRLRPVP